MSADTAAVSQADATEARRPAVTVPPRYWTIGAADHVRLVEQLGDINAEEFSREFGSAINRHSLHSLIGKVQMKAGCIFCGDLLLRGDIATGSIDLGKCVVLGESVLVRPPVHRISDSDLRMVPVTVGEHVIVGQRTIVEASRIGSCVIIESDCVLGPECELHHGVWLKSGSVVPRGAKLMPFGVYEGHPARLIGQLNPDAGLFEVRDLVLDVIRRSGLLSYE